MFLICAKHINKRKAKFNFFFCIKFWSSMAYASCFPPTNIVILSKISSCPLRVMTGMQMWTRQWHSYSSSISVWLLCFLSVFRMNNAEACFFLISYYEVDKTSSVSFLKPPQYTLVSTMQGYCLEWVETNKQTNTQIKQTSKLKQKSQKP